MRAHNNKNIARETLENNVDHHVLGGVGVVRQVNGIADFWV